MVKRHQGSSSNRRRATAPTQAQPAGACGTGVDQAFAIATMPRSASVAAVSTPSRKKPAKRSRLLCARPTACGGLRLVRLEGNCSSRPGVRQQAPHCSSSAAISSRPMRPLPSRNGVDGHRTARAPRATRTRGGSAGSGSWMKANSRSTSSPGTWSGGGGTSVARPGRADRVLRAPPVRLAACRRHVRHRAAGGVRPHSKRTEIREADLAAGPATSRNARR